ncbi:MAG TPA: hypothetical protein VGE93_02405, partial [Bryobacteraceae bacterium]
RALAAAAARGDQLRINAGMQVWRGAAALVPVATSVNATPSGDAHSAPAVETRPPKVLPVTTTTERTLSRVSGNVSHERIDTDAIGDEFANF